MERIGIVIAFDKRTSTGVIRDGKREFFFYAERSPGLFQLVSFNKDIDYKSTDVAMNVKPRYAQQTA